MSILAALRDVRAQRDAESSIGTGPSVLTRVLRAALRDWQLTGAERVVVRDCLETLCAISSHTTIAQYRAIFLLLHRDTQWLAKSPDDHVRRSFRFCPSWIASWLSSLDHLECRAAASGVARP